MCGIGGVHLKQGQSIQKEALENLAKGLAHRGPDDQGIELYGSTAFVHRRLSIIDVAGGHQPLSTSQKPQVSVVVNGEIYNYLELKEKYQHYPFLTASDSEVLLPLYLDKHDNFLDTIRGMYALALYDQDRDRLILARDPFGIKQLYYTIDDTGISFASEPQALIKAGVARTLIHPPTRAEILQARYAMGAQSIWADIKRVLPGEVLVFEGGKLSHQWRVQGYLSESQKITKNQALDQFDTLIKESVALHLRTDVPLGLFLSGGLDSGLLLHTMRDMPSLKTYTIGFDHGSVHDERETAEKLAKRYQTDHHSLVCTEKDFWETLPLVAQAVDDPVFDHALVPTYLLAKAAARDVRVVLCGEGGDELLAGYRRYQRARLPTWLGGRLYRTKGVFDKIAMASPHLKDWLQSPQQAEEFLKPHKLTRLQQAQFMDGQGWLAHSLLIKLDRCLMAHGLEGRTPFLEPHLAAFCLSLPDHLKIKWGWGKWLLRQYIDKVAPHLNPFSKKKGFNVPVNAWLLSKGPRLGALIARQPGVDDLFQREVILDLFSHMTPPRAYAAWMILFYALWHQIHVMKIPVCGDTMTMLFKK